MNEEMRAEAIEMSITACEKYAPNYEVHLTYLNKQKIIIIIIANKLNVNIYTSWEFIGCCKSYKGNNG